MIAMQRAAKFSALFFGNFHGRDVPSGRLYVVRIKKIPPPAYAGGGTEFKY